MCNLDIKHNTYLRLQNFLISKLTDPFQRSYELINVNVNSAFYDELASYLLTSKMMTKCR